MYPMYFIQDKEAGNIIARFKTRAEAEEAVKRYEREDKASGNYSIDFYEICKVK